MTLTEDVGPVTGEIADGRITDDPRPTFSGSATADIDHVNTREVRRQAMQTKKPASVLAFSR